MAGREVIKSVFLRPGEQAAEFQAAVAVNAGIRGMAVQVFLHEMIHDFFAKAFHQVQGKISDPDPFRHSPGVIHIFYAAAAVLLLKPDSGIIIKTHGTARDLIALLFQKPGRDRRIHAAAHSNENPAFAHLLSLFFRYGAYCRSVLLPGSS